MTPMLGIMASQISGHLFGTYSYAYIAGGYQNTATTGKQTRIEKFLYSADTISTLSAVLSAARYTQAGLTNFLNFGYWAGGADSADASTSSITKMTYSTDTTSTLSATLGSAIQSSGSASNLSTAGYVMGGVTTVGTNIIQKLTYSGETTSTISATLTSAKQGQCGWNDGSTAGYTAGGYISAQTTQIDKLTFSTEVKSADNALSQAVNGEGGYSNAGSAGYAAGGYTGSAFYSGIQKHTFSGNVSSVLSTTLAEGWSSGASASNATTAGYTFAGDTFNEIYKSYITKLPYSTETRSTISATTAHTVYYPTGISTNG